MTVECNDPGDAKTLSVSVAGGEVVEAELLKWEDGYACVNIPVENKTALKSVSSVEVADESLKVEGTTSSYRNANTVYDGTKASKDTSWYNDNDAEFVILTSADLYGFQSLSADNTFEGKTIYMASDIIVNSGSPLADNWSNATVGQSLKAWSPIGPTSTYAFGGTFDGDNHTISSFLDTEEVLDVKAVTTPRTAWYVESNYENTDTYTLYTKADMYGFASLQADFEGKTIKLGADIKMNEGTATAERFEAEQGTTPIMWTPKNMAGTFDGDNHTIQGIYLDTDKGNAGLFASVTGTVKNLRLQNSYFHCEDSAPANYASTEYFHGLGSIAGSLSGTLDTVYSDAIVSQDYAYAGGLVGTVYGESRITNSCFAGQVTAYQAAGGVVGLVIAKATFEHCLNTGTVTAKDQVAGGLCAYVWTDGELHLNDSLNAGRGASKDTVNYFGGAVGWVRENEHTHTIDDTYYIKFYIDADNSWANLVEKGKNTQMKIDGADVTGKQQNYNGWNEYAIIAKAKDENTKLHLSFYADGEDSSSDGDNKTCWWVDREDKIPMLESFEDLLVNVQY